jgi:ribulose-phosphate 3-epimerase
MKLIAPSILSADAARLGEEIAAVEEAGADWIHVDVMDGRFVPNITMGPAIVGSLRKTTKLPFDVHLMIKNPDAFVQSFADAGADYITVHVEAVSHLHRSIELIKKTGKKAGVSLNPATPLNLVEEILPEIDLLLIMSVNPGFGGQQFIKSSLLKIKRAHEMIERLTGKTLLEVDGGVNLQNIASIAQAGADVLVAGAAIFGTRDYKKTIIALKDAVSNS